MKFQFPMGSRTPSPLRSAHEGYYKQIVSLVSLYLPRMSSRVSLFLTLSSSVHHGLHVHHINIFANQTF